MAYYVCSDIHGRYDRYLKLLETIQLSAEDTLFVLGDVIDRNPDGLTVLQDIARRDNVELFLGNHELFLYDSIAVNGDEFVTNEYWKSIWCSQNNGGAITFQAFQALDDEAKRQILHMIKNSTLIRVLDVHGVRYHLSHSSTLPVLESDYYGFQDVPVEMAESVVWKSVFRKGDYHFNRKKLDKNMQYIVGHVPVQRFTRGSGICRYHQVTDIDCGCAYPFLKGNRLACLRLDDMGEFYIE